MHDLLSFMPRPRMKPTDDIRATVSDLVNDIQVLAQSDSASVLKVLAKYTRHQRRRIHRRADQHGRL